MSSRTSTCASSPSTSTRWVECLHLRDLAVCVGGCGCMDVNAHAHTRTRARAHTQEHTHSLCLSHTHTSTHARTRTHTHAHARTRTHLPTPTHSRTPTYRRRPRRRWTGHPHTPICVHISKHIHPDADQGGDGPAQCAQHGAASAWRRNLPQWQRFRL